jgi:Protein of unknown function (DUF2891)
MLALDRASQCAEIALGHVTREYPNKLDHVLAGPADLQAPRALHPIFYGSFDWHSCVHGYWLLARLLRAYPDLPQGERIHLLFRSALTQDHVAAELSYLASPMTATFERPYGWAWLLMLAAELALHPIEEMRLWSVTLQPLADEFSRRFINFLKKATYPVRSGVHSNTAFAITLAVGYAKTSGDSVLAEAVTLAARRWYLGDADCQAWEPSGEDFLSPSLMEAECMRQVLSPDEFSTWFTRFLPRLEQGEPSALFQPARVSDRSDGRIAHLDGLNLTRAWCWSNLASGFAPTTARCQVMREAARRHLEAALPHITGDYMGEHWLATFAWLALEATNRG